MNGTSKVLQENKGAKHDQRTKNFDVAIKMYTYTAAFFIGTLNDVEVPRIHPHTPIPTLVTTFHV